MGVLSFTLVRPSALLCTSLVLLAFLYPQACEAGGKKVIPPVKHLFGVGIGYQKVVHYKPVLVISKSRRVKHKRPSGWGWSSGGGHKYTPIKGKRGYAAGWGAPPPPQQHRRKRKRPPPPPPPQIHSGRGWGGGGGGWRPGPGPSWSRPSRPHRNHRKGHDEEPPRYHNLDTHNRNKYHQSNEQMEEIVPMRNHNHNHGTRGDVNDRERDSRERDYHRPTSQHGGGGGSGGGRQRHNNNNHESMEHPTSLPHHEIAYSPPTVHTYYEDGVIWGTRAVDSNGRPMFYPASSSNNYYGSPYSSMEDMDDDHGGYESEIREQWKTDEEITSSSTPSSEPTSSTVPPVPTPPLYPFTDHGPPPQGDGGITNVNRDFLKTHMKNFYQFQEYNQQASTSPGKPNGQQNNQGMNNQFAPSPPQRPGRPTNNPFFSTNSPPHFSEQEERGSNNNDVQYEDEYPSYDDKRSEEDNYNDYNGGNELKRKMMPAASSLKMMTTTPKPSMASMQQSSSNIRPTITTLPKNDKKFKPSPRVDEIGNGNSFNRPGFFPAHSQFKIT